MSKSSPISAIVSLSPSNKPKYLLNTFNSLLVSVFNIPRIKSIRFSSLSKTSETIFPHLEKVVTLIFTTEKFSGNHTWDYNWRNPMTKSPLKKVVYNQSVPHIHPPYKSFRWWKGVNSSMKQG
uniref:Uncharacterized protein n=1 Tax=uncultured delta proteobacterium HF4000_08N17 TaxID=710836 RepID=E0XVD8_9DELT|nr:hypothetical protein [uncultured delta proteobacterium HF4000_08N17]